MLVHEATHARLWGCGIPYTVANRDRVERACLRAEMRFASRMPNPTITLEWIEAKLKNASSWSDSSLRERRKHEIGGFDLPNWLRRFLR
jgi:hypothetical protein